MELGGGFDGDPVAHSRELSDGVAQPAFDGDAVGVVLGAQVAEAGGRVGEQVPDDDQDGAGDRDESLELASAFDQTPIALAEEGFGFGGRGGGLTERALQIRVAWRMRRRFTICGSIWRSCAASWRTTRRARTTC